MDQQISNELPPVQNQPVNPNMAGAMYGEAPQSEAGYGQAMEQGMLPSAQPPQQTVQSSHPVAQPLPSQPPVFQQPTPQQLSSMPVIADDTDLIEKEWVEKAKEIVERTKHDPYQQNKEVEKVKADYLKKRYDKDIKLTTD